ncbi:hypothetical protein H8D64_00210 [PVC group bacterium]|nr:hypothetical protein [PVC group bacterium]
MAVFNVERIIQTPSGLVAVMIARLTALSLFMFTLSLILPGDNLAFYLFMALGYIITIPYALWLRDLRRNSRYISLQFLVDLVLVTGLVYFSGGIDSDLCFLYPLIILSAGIVAGPRRAMQVAVLSSLTYAILVVLTSQGILVGYNGEILAQDWLEVSQTVGWRALVFLCFGMGSSYLSKRCYYAEKGVTELRKMSEIIFRKMSAGLMLLDSKGKIAKTNDFACHMLMRKKTDLLGMLFSDIEDTTGNHKYAGQSTESVVCYLKKGDDSILPVTRETTVISLPASMLDLESAEEFVKASIVVIADVSKILNMEDKAIRTSHLRAAASAAAEIAHEIRNPLSVVSCAVEALKRMESRLEHESDPSEQEKVKKVRRQMFSHIVSESIRLDQTIEQFIKCDKSTPDQIASLLQIQDGDY